jgi:hypothetical protein
MELLCQKNPQACVDSGGARRDLAGKPTLLREGRDKGRSARLLGGTYSAGCDGRCFTVADARAAPRHELLLTPTHCWEGRGVIWVKARFVLN